WAWKTMLERRDGPAGIALSRQNLPVFDRSKVASAEGVAKGAYVLADAPSGNPDVVIIASGSEVAIALEAHAALAGEGVQARVVSMPSQEIFLKQSADYQASVLPPGAKRVAVEAGHPMSWQRFTGTDGAVIGIESFGASAPYQRLYKEYGITAEAVVAAAKRVAS
ncbi:MAG: transketolase-like TK C-terminal-containing protein, partial [Gemmatimonadota bacterium]